jgi:hypothetical protein
MPTMGRGSKHHWRRRNTVRAKMGIRRKPSRAPWFRREDLPTYLNLLPSIVLAFVAYFALDESKHATNEMVDQVTEAQRQAKIAEEQLILSQRSLRPWVFATEIKASGQPFFGQPVVLHEIDFTVSLVYKNSGNQPAINVHSSLKTRLKLLVPSPGEAGDISCEKASDGEALFPGETKPVTSTVTINVNEWNALKGKGLKEILLVGCISYNSAFDQSFHTTRMAYVVMLNEAKDRYVPFPDEMTEVDPSKISLFAVFASGNFRAD